MLKCVSKYRSSLGSFAVNDVVEDPRLEQQLLADSPESFLLVDSREQAEELKVDAQLVDAPRLRGFRRKA